MSTSAPPGEPGGAVLLAVRIHDGFLGGWELTPIGEDGFASGSPAGRADSPTW
jgi:hypothetical protein